MSGRRTSGVAYLLYLCMILGGRESWLVRAGGGFTHWLVTEEGKIEFQIGSPFNLKQPHNLYALIQQEQRVSTLVTLRDQLLNFRETFQIFGHYHSFEESFFARDPDCRSVPSVTTFDLYISTVLPLDHKMVSLSDHLDPADSLYPGEPHCKSPLDYSIYALDHLKGIQERDLLVGTPERSVLSSLNMNTEMFGSLVGRALEKNSTSWVLLDLASLYWRARGNVFNAIECIRRSLHHSPRSAADVAYLNLANVLHRSDRSSDAVVPLNMAIEISPDLNILRYTLGNVYVSLGEFNDSLAQFRYSLSLEPTSEAVLSIYSSVLCEIRKYDASLEYGRQLDETQAKLDEFYEKVELVKKAHVVEKGHRGQWDIDTSGWSSGKKVEEEEKEKRENEIRTKSELNQTEETQFTTAENDTTVQSENRSSDGLSSVDPSSNGTTSQPVMPPNRGSGKFRLVLRPLCEEECSKCGTKSGLDRFKIDQPVCRSPSPFLNYSRHPSGYCAETRVDCAEIERLGTPGTIFCEVKGHPTVLSYTREVTDNDDDDVSMTTKPFLSCPTDEGEEDDIHRSRCLKKLQEELRVAEQHRTNQRDRMMEREKIRKASKKSETSQPKQPPQEASKINEKGEGGRRGGGGGGGELSKVQEKNNEKVVTSTKPKESKLYSKMFQNIEFLPFNPLPLHLDEVIFPERSRPLQIFEDPYWPNKASCIRLVESLGTATSSFSTYTGAYLSPNAKGANTEAFFKIVPYPVPPYLRQQPRCTDIKELSFSLQALDHLYPVQYRSLLEANKRQSENGLKQVFINAVSEAMGQSLSFEEAGEAVYAAMVKNRPNWALFVVASLYWRVSGDPKHSIECLRRALHYSPNSVKDVSYVAMANVFHRHGYLREAVIAARASLDVFEHSPVGHYTLAGIYLTLRDYTSSGLHLRSALHLQPSFEHALSALRLVRCFLKFNQEYQLLIHRLSQPEGKTLKQFETLLKTDLVRAIETLRSYEKVRQPPLISKPDDVMVREGEKSPEELFTGEDAIKYATNLAVRRNNRKERGEEEEEEAEEEVERFKREAIEQRLREEMTKFESDGSLEEYLKKKREEEGENGFAKNVHYEPNQLDITPLMQQVANRIQAEQNNYDPQLIAQSRAEIEVELREIVLASARAIANKQSPAQHTKPVSVIENDAQNQSPLNLKSPKVEVASGDDTAGSYLPKMEEEGDREKVEIEEEEEEKMEEKEEEKSSESGDTKIERYPGYQPWPTMQDCSEMSFHKILIFTSTWLSVTAKKINVSELVDFEATLDDTSLKPYCPNSVPDPSRTFPTLAGMSGPTLVEQYKPERGLIEVFTNLSGSHHSVEDVATRLNISMSKNESSWILSNLAALYWRIYGEGELAVNCLRHALYHSDHSNKEVALVSLGNVLYRMGYETDATAVLQHSLEVNPKMVVNHFTMANLLAARGFVAEAASYFEATLQFQPGFEPAIERLQAVRCLTLLKHLQMKREKEEKRQREYEAEVEKQLYEHRKSLGHFN